MVEDRGSAIEFEGEQATAPCSHTSTPNYWFRSTLGFCINQKRKKRLQVLEGVIKLESEKAKWSNGSKFGSPFITADDKDGAINDGKDKERFVLPLSTEVCLCLLHLEKLCTRKSDGSLSKCSQR